MKKSPSPLSSLLEQAQAGHAYQEHAHAQFVLGCIYEHGKTYDDGSDPDDMPF